MRREAVYQIVRCDICLFPVCAELELVAAIHVNGMSKCGASRFRLPMGPGLRPGLRHERARFGSDIPEELREEL